MMEPLEMEHIITDKHTVKMNNKSAVMKIGRAHV